jgi:hypothetical protein
VEDKTEQVSKLTQSCQDHHEKEIEKLKKSLEQSRLTEMRVSQSLSEIQAELNLK